jgi:hypothetical protein
MAVAQLATFENSVATINWDAENRIMLFTWKTFATGQPFYEALQQNIRLVQQVQATKQLTNTVRARTFTQADQKWLSANYVQQMHQAGIRSVAFLLPISEVAQLAQWYMLRSAQKELAGQACNIGIYPSFDDALAWLKGQV